jgi:tellurite resistance protein
VILTYEIGLNEIEDPAMRSMYEEMCRWSDAEPEKHEFAAYLLMMAVRKEWEMVELCRRGKQRRVTKKR